jgi:arginyl-tRNA synthetase
LKDQITQALREAVAQLSNGNALDEIDFQVTRAKDPDHGDYASNIALVCAKKMQLPPREFAQQLCRHLNDLPFINKVEIAGPGFINFFMASASRNEIIRIILQQAENFGCNNIGTNQSVYLEFVSANPTGPLHVGHGRGAAYGASIGNLYAANGYKVHREYYVNDAGRQMDILATSVWLRYLELSGAEMPFPSNGYKGDYVWDIAATAHRTYEDRYAIDPASFLNELPKDEGDGGDKEEYIDAMIQIAKRELDDGYALFFDLANQTILDDIRDDLHLFGVDYDNWYSERSLFETHKIDDVISKLKTSGHIYEKNGALWFASEKLGDEKDRVVVRENGQPTYFASDIAYHADKFAQGYSKVVNIWGADHHGYIARVKAALTALGLEADRLEILLVQFANLFRGKEKLQMSTRSGEFVTLRSLRKEVGVDAARFFYVMRKSEQHLDFDLELAKSTSNENPVYYIQYAHARICSMLKQVNIEKDELLQTDTSSLSADNEQGLMKKLAEYPDVIANACEKQAPHLVVNYLRELSQLFHNYYNTTQVLVDDLKIRNARACLITCVKQTIANGLNIIGVSAPDKM